MNQEKVGKFIATLRKENGYTQKDLGDMLGITDNSVSKWERGINAPDIAVLNSLSDIFHISVEEILNGERKFKKKEKDPEHHQKVLEVKNLSKSFGKRKILEDIEFDLYEGDIVGLIGANGAGKTTLMKTILNLYKANSGIVKICGFDTRKNFEEALSKVGCVIENPDMYQKISGRRNLEITALINHIQDREFIEKMIKFAKLEERIDDKVKKYSLGMKQRLGFINALIKKPKLLILDEPMNGLDPLGIKELREMLLKISREENITILISSHILKEIENICDRIIILNNGKIESEFGIEEVKYKNISLEEEYFEKIYSKNTKGENEK